MKALAAMLVLVCTAGLAEHRPASALSLGFTDPKSMLGFGPLPKSVTLRMGGGITIGFPGVIKTRTDRNGWQVISNLPPIQFNSNFVYKFTLPVTNSVQFFQLSFTRKLITEVTGDASAPIGWYQREIKPFQWDFLADQLWQQTPTIGDLFRGCPAGSLVKCQAGETPVMLRFNGGWGLVNGYSADDGRVGPGSAFMFFNPTSNTLTLTVSGTISKVGGFLKRGYSAFGYWHPRGGSVDELGLPMEAGDVVQKLGPSGDMISFTNTAEGWKPIVPRVEIGEGFVVTKVNDSPWGDFEKPRPWVDPQIYNNTIADHLFDDPMPASCLQSEDDAAWLLIHADPGTCELEEHIGGKWRAVREVTVGPGSRAAVWVSDKRGEYRVRQQ